MYKNCLTTLKLAVALLGLTLVSTASMANSVARVTNGDNSGPGSLRHALQSGANKIIVKPSVASIWIHETLSYTGTKPLKIIGGGSTVRGSDDFTLLAITKGADLSIKNMNFVGIGGFSVHTPSLGRGKGIFVDVLGTGEQRSDTVHLNLTHVTVSDVGYHGVHVSDCDGGDECGSGGDSGGKGSDASVYAMLRNVVIENVGYGVFDADGLRIDERDEGDIFLNATNSTFVGVGADGAELDEDGSGNVIVSVRNTRFITNGGYCEGLDIENPIDEKCIDDGELDLDDGFDIDEAGDGSLVGLVRNVVVNGNLDEGLDFDEKGEGDIRLRLTNIHAQSNGDEAIKASEEDAGDVIVDLRAIRANNNGDNGIQIEQFVDGEVQVVVKGSILVENDKDSLKVESFADADGEVDGQGSLKVRGSLIDGIDTNVEEL